MNRQLKKTQNIGERSAKSFKTCKILKTVQAIFFKKQHFEKFAGNYLLKNAKKTGKKNVSKS